MTATATTENAKLAATLEAETLERAKVVWEREHGQPVPLTEAEIIRAAVAAERERCASAVREAANGCALADNRAQVERFRAVVLELIEGPNAELTGRPALR